MPSMTTLVLMDPSARPAKVSSSSALTSAGTSRVLVMERGEADAVGGGIVGVEAGRELVLRDAQQRVLDGLDDVLGRGRDDAGLDARQRLVLVGVDADGEDAVRLARRLEGAVAGQTAGAEDDVSAAVDHLLGRVAALGRIDERGRVDEVGLDVRVDRLRAVDVTLDEAFHRRDDDEAADDADVAGLAQGSCEDAGEVPRLVFGEEERLAVGHPALVVAGVRHAVDGEELDVRVGLGRIAERIAEQEPDTDDDIRAAVRELGDVRRVVGLARRLDVLGLEAARCGFCSGQHALIGRLVEALVIDATDVRYETNAERGVAGDALGWGGCRRLRRSGCRLGRRGRRDRRCRRRSGRGAATATCGDEDGETRKQGQAVALVHESSSKPCRPADGAMATWDPSRPAHAGRRRWGIVQHGPSVTHTRI